MFAASPPPHPAWTRASHSRWAVLAVCGLISLLLHGVLVMLWSGGEAAPGFGSGRVRASIRALPVAVMPARTASPPLAPAAQPTQPAAAALREAPPSVAGADVRAELGSPAEAPPLAGGGRLLDYMPVEALSSRPRFLVDMSEYVPASLDAAESGRIVLQLLIAANGDVEGVVLENSELSPRGTRRFVQRMNALKLAPGLHEGRPVAARWRLEFSFAALE